MSSVTRESGTQANDSSVGTFGWASLSSVVTQDNEFSSVTLGSSGISYYLKCTNFGFSIPTDATINGIVTRVYKKASLSNAIRDNSVKLVLSGSISGASKASVSYWSTSNAYVNYGTSSDTWGLSLTPTSVNASNFGVAFSAKAAASGGIAYVDYIGITVYYTVSAGPINVKTYNGLAAASLKTLRSGLLIASGKTWDGLT